MRPVLLLLLGSVLAGCGVAAPAPDIPRETSTPPPPCPEPGVRITAVGVDAAMGLRTMTLRMTNCGSKPYAVNGYPVVRVLGEDRGPLDVTVGEGASPVATLPEFDARPQSVTLAPGEMVEAGLVWRNLVTDSTVQATKGSYLEVAPAPGVPAQTFPAYVEGMESPDGARIDLGNTDRMGMQPWARPKN
jgi:hypothetical protein